METENYSLEKDITIFGVKAKSFPDGIEAAYHRVMDLTKDTGKRNFFGISFQDKDGNIIYHACVKENFPSEGKKIECDEFNIKAGKYTSILINDFVNNIPSIGKAFNELMKNPDIDPNGACVEMYSDNNDVRCMIRLKSN